MAQQRSALLGGVDLGGTKIQTVVLSGGKVVGAARVPTPRDGAPAVLTAIQGALQAAALEAGGRLGSIGLGSPGEIDAGSGSVSHANNVPGFEGTVAVGPTLAAAFGGVPVAIDNDVRVGILGEHRLGAGRPYANLLGVWVGTGVGGGVIVEGKLLEGRGAAGEIGHTIVKDGGRLCSCGRRGCLEAYAGRGRMELRARAWQERGRKTILFKLMEERGADRLTSGTIARALKRGDRVAEKLVARARWALSVALASAQNLLDLEAIIIGGGLGDRLGPEFAGAVAEGMRPHLFVPERPPAVLSTELGDLAGAVGAALLGGEASGS